MSGDGDAAPCGRYVNRARACLVHTHTRHDAACRRRRGGPTLRGRHVGMSAEQRNSKMVPVKGLSWCSQLNNETQKKINRSKCVCPPGFNVSVHTLLWHAKKVYADVTIRKYSNAVLLINKILHSISKE